LKFQLPKIYPITDRRLSGLSHTDQVARLIDGGATLIQLREKRLPAGEFYEDARKAVMAAHRHGVKIVINDRVDVALAAGADGVHVGQDDLPPAEVRKMLGDGAIVGFSTHSIEQAATAKLLPVSYIAFGPVFPTRTKDDPDPVVGIAGLAAVREALGDTPLVAIGGIDAANAPDVIAAGAHSLAVIGALCTSHDPAAAFAELLNVVVNV